MPFSTYPGQARRRLAWSVAALTTGLAVPTSLPAQDYAARAAAAGAYIASHADREEKVLMPMRDGIRLSALILFPKGQPRQNLPTVMFRNPYLTESMLRNFGVYVRSLLEHGYAVIFQNERGRYFSEGTFTYLVGSGNDGYDSIDWITKQGWSNGKVGLLGCSSSAEEQHKVQGMNHPGLAAGVPMGSGAGIGKVGPYNEMGNFFRGGVMQPLWFSWYYGSGYKYRPAFPANLPRETMIRLGKFWNLAPETMPPSGLDSLVWTLPIGRIMERMGAAPSDIDDFITWAPNDPRWKTIDFGGEGDRASAPILMINSWYDVSIGPNVAYHEYQSKNAANDHARANQFMVIAPTMHCEEGAVESEHTIVGQRDMGDARFDYTGLVQQWFDHFLKGIDNGVTNQPKVRAYMMGANQWRTYDTWPPKEAQEVIYYLDSDGGANSLLGNGRLATTKPVKAGRDAFVYDPMRPVPTLGGSVSHQGGSIDQTGIEMRNDVLVYTTLPLAERVEITGPVKVSLYLSSDAKDTDLTVKLLDVEPDGKAYNLDESIQRVRWREGWDKAVFMEPGKAYKVDVGPLATSNAFLPGHRIRIEVSSSNFPRFERNLNTGGNNFDEKDGVVAHNVILHAPASPSAVVLPVLRGGRAGGMR